MTIVPSNDGVCDRTSYLCSLALLHARVLTLPKSLHARQMYLSQPMMLCQVSSALQRQQQEEKGGIVAGNGIGPSIITHMTPNTVSRAQQSCLSTWQRTAHLQMPPCRSMSTRMP